MERNKKIFPHPMVEYIPLPFRELQWGRKEHNQGRRLYLKKDLGEITLFKGEKEGQGQEKFIYLLLFNGRIRIMKYRGYQVTMVGEKKKDYYQICGLTCRYFYKDRLSFLLFTPKGEKIAQDSVIIKPW